MDSPTKEISSPVKEVLIPTHPMLTRRRYRVKATRRRSSRTNTRPQYYGSSSGEDTSNATRLMVSRSKQRGKLTRRQSSRAIRRPRSDEESSLSGLGELQSTVPRMRYASDTETGLEYTSKQVDLIPISIAQGSPPLMEDPLTTTYQKVTESEIDIQPTPGNSTKRSRISLDKEGATCQLRRSRRGMFGMKSPNKQFGKGNTSFPGKKGFILGNCITSRGGQVIQVADRNSSLGEQPIFPQGVVQPHQDINSFQNDTPLSLGIFDSEQHYFTQQDLSMLQMYVIPPQQQFYDSRMSMPVQDQYYDPQNASYSLEEFFENQQAPAMFDHSNIDPALLGPSQLDPNFIDPTLLGITCQETDTFNPNFDLPLDPALLTMGEPMRIPIEEVKHFHPLHNSHEEPCSFALSDSEGDIDGPATPKSIPESTTGNTTEPGPVEKLIVVKYIYTTRDPEEQKRKLGAQRKHRAITMSCKPSGNSKKRTSSDTYSRSASHHSPVRGRKSVKSHIPVRESRPVEVNPPMNIQSAKQKRKYTRKLNIPEDQTRFVLLLHIYFGLSSSKIVEVFNKEFADSMSAQGIRSRLGFALHEPKFGEYREILTKSKRGTRGLQGLDDGLLAEANRFARCLEQ